eukprot:scaffold499_cov129-Isochrysis_galbana.AAC.4
MLGTTEGVPPPPVSTGLVLARSEGTATDVLAALAHLCPCALPMCQPPFIVTSCQHAFCEKHAREPNFDESTCPGCRSHVSRVGGGGGMRSTSYVLNESDQDVLNGTTPEVAIGVALNAVQFW